MSNHGNKTGSPLCQMAAGAVLFLVSAGLPAEDFRKAAAKSDEAYLSTVMNGLASVQGQGATSVEADKQNSAELAGFWQRELSSRMKSGPV
jgi:hypothetical protein